MASTTAVQSATPPDVAPAGRGAVRALPAERPADDSDPFRYGVYLRPDPRTCRAVTVATDQLRAQYGLVSAGAFPPHATLVGSQPFGASQAEVVDALTTLLKGRRPFPVHNSGIDAHGFGYVYDIDRRADGSANNELHQLAADVDAAVAPFRRPVGSPESNDFVTAHYRAHLSLASHDLLERPDLHDEVGAYLRELDVPVPTGFDGDTVALYRTASPDWSGRWWRSMTWQHIRTWTLGGR